MARSLLLACKWPTVKAAVALHTVYGDGITRLYIHLITNPEYESENVWQYRNNFINMNLNYISGLAAQPISNSH